MLGEASWEFQSYAQLADRVRSAARQLHEAGVERGDIVGIAEANCDDFATAFFGVLHAGATPLPLAPHASLDVHHAARLSAILRSASPAFVACSDDAIGDIASATRRAGCEAALLRLGGGRVAAGDPEEPAELALLQFTSGATGSPRGVRITRPNLESNVAMIGHWAGIDSITAGTSWLPLHHDMGLIGLITWVCAQIDSWPLRPEQFILDPVRWLEPLATGGTTSTAAPNFAFSYAARRVAPERLRGLDFSGWRSAIVGAERVIPAALAAFAELLADHGFRPEAFCPAYGMAEATLAVTGDPIGRLARMVRIGWERMDVGKPVEIRDTRPITDASRVDSTGFVLSCGPPLAGVTVEVIADDGSPLPEGTLGEITIEGPSVAAGYHTDEIGGTRFDEGRILTGDAGFMLDGELFVIGRMGDSIKLGGRHVWAESLEIQIAAAIGTAPHRCLVVSAPGAVSETVAVLVEGPRRDWVDTAASLVRSEVGAAADLVLYAAEPGTILRTTSGKPRRREMWRQLTSDGIAAERVGHLRARVLRSR
jgi:acyl-CoA synthetase (AMP-forming)/AMP-acid ligase II